MFRDGVSAENLWDASHVRGMSIFCVGDCAANYENCDAKFLERCVFHVTSFEVSVEKSSDS